MIFSSPNINDKLKEILKRKFEYTDDMIMFMEQTHMNALVSVVLEEASGYFEDNNKQEELNELSEISTRLEGNVYLSEPDIKAAYRLLEINLKAYEKYPDLAEKIDQRMSKIREDVLSEIFKTLHEEEAIEFLQAVKEEVDQYSMISKTIGEK